jgi:hypothetical protein
MPGASWFAYVCQTFLRFSRDHMGETNTTPNLMGMATLREFDGSSGAEERTPSLGAPLFSEFYGKT